MLVPLKPIYGQSPLTTVKSIALRPGQVRMESEKLSTLYTMLCAAGKNHPAAWEPAFRMACLLNGKPTAGFPPLPIPSVRAAPLTCP